MNIVLNLLPLKTGGGVQVALDFLSWIESLGKDHQWYVVCRQGSCFSSLSGSNLKVVACIPDTLLRRLHFEYMACQSLMRSLHADVVFTLFGPQWPGYKGLNVVGCAYSNLFYPELDFWRGLPFAKRWVKKIIDWQRLKRLHAAEYRIFETEDLAERAQKLFGYDQSNVFVVRPSCSSLVTKNRIHQETRDKAKMLPKGYKILLVAGYHPNKNIELLIRSAGVLAEKGYKDVCFVLTIAKGSPGEKRILELANELGVRDYVYNFGTVPQEGCCELYRACDVAVLPSTLESFSNMIAESWAMEKPLLISDMSWSRSLCKDGALYFSHRNEFSLAEKLEVLLHGKIELAETIENGSKQLMRYPEPQERFMQYLDVIVHACNKERRCTA